jgi:hypothetical protein
MARKYSPSASKDVEREMHKFKRGNLKSGKVGKGGTVKESQASHCHRAFRGAQKGQEAPEEKGQLSVASHGRFFAYGRFFGDRRCGF